MKPITQSLALALTIITVITFGQNPSRYIDPMIGTGGHGHTYPGASMPFGMVQLSPDTRLEGWDGCSAYHIADSVIYGFSHTHLSGTGCSDYGDILLMPVGGEVSLDGYAYRSAFRRNPGNETASPDYYKVLLDRYGILAELTAAPRTGFHRYTFPGNCKQGLVVDLNHRDQVLESSLKIVSPTEMEGMRTSRAWAEKQILYFVIRFSEPISSCVLNHSQGSLTQGKSVSGTDLIALLMFGNTSGKTLLIKVGLSAVSAEGARKNLEEEIPGWNFEEIRTHGENAWNDELSKITVSGGTDAQKTVFYTALYHAFLAPNLYCDVDGNYRGRDLAVHNAKGYQYYTVFSLWDTYRAEHPLFNLLQLKRNADFIRTFLDQYDQGGLLPVWELSANETDCMIGYHAAPVIADAWIKGVRGFDGGKALEAMKHSAMQDVRGLKDYREKGYIPADREGESVSKTLEYSYDDWCIAMMAKSLGKQDDYIIYIKRAQNYKNLFDPTTGFMRAKANETWVAPFRPNEVNFNFTEANSWQYSFSIPQDITGLMNLHGGTSRLAGKLYQLITEDTRTTGRQQSDITGLIGQYAHGNEPSHHIAYLFDYVAQPWKTQKMVSTICRELYSDKPDGLCGNEDCGQMSAWYVMSALGFYPVTPGSLVYAIGSPVFPEAVIHFDGGKTFTVTASNLSNDNFYIQSATLNGKPYTKCYLTHADLMTGGTLSFVMGPAPNRNWGVNPGDLPTAAITDHLITPVPAVLNGKKVFADTLTIILTNAEAGGTTYFTLDGTEPDQSSPKYIKPILLDKTTTLKALTTAPGLPPSATITATFRKISDERKIELFSRYSPQYTGGGDLALIDQERGGENFKSGTWQGYEGVDLVAIVDLNQPTSVKQLGCEFLQVQRAWIFMPTEVVFELSLDGVNYSPAGTVVNNVADNNEEAVIKDFRLDISPTAARYVRVTAKNRGVCPAWHPGAGGKAWIFADEITIE